MISKAIIKDIQNLAHKEGRDEQGLFLAEGVKWAEELLQAASHQIGCLYAKPTWLQANEHLLSGITVEEVDDVMMHRLSQLHSPQDVLMTVRMFDRQIISATEGIHLVLSTIQDPGNLGTLIRTADWFGVKQVVCSSDCVDPYNPKVVQATMGSLIRIPVVNTDLSEWLRKQTDLPTFAAILSGADYTTAHGPGILMLGNESKGLSPALLDLATNPITIPRIGQAESLNVSVAAGILLSQLSR